MTDIQSLSINDLDNMIQQFESSSYSDEDGDSYWLARDLQSLLSYKTWEGFEAVINRAKDACAGSGQSITDHFRDVSKMVAIGSSAGRQIRDIQLSRYACYLITQNGDPSKKPVAFGQTYFAIQTRRQELADKASNEVAVPQSEDERRIIIRNQIKEHNRYLSSAAKDAGVTTPLDFAIFHSKGYQGLYGKTLPQLRTYRGLAKKADVLDHMGSTELAANFFRVTQTEEKLRNENIKNKDKANATHYAVGKQVREAMLKISGTAPENLPSADHIRLAEKRHKAEITASSKYLEDRSKKKEIIIKHSSNEEVENLQSDSTIEKDLLPINLHLDLWKVALIIMALNEDGFISTPELIDRLPSFITPPLGSEETLPSRKDSRFSQLVRNLKSHRNNKNNFIYLGYAESVPNGFQITEKGREFVIKYLSEWANT